MRMTHNNAAEKLWTISDPPSLMLSSTRLPLCHLIHVHTPATTGPLAPLTPRTRAHAGARRSGGGGERVRGTGERWGRLAVAW